MIRAALPMVAAIALSVVCSQVWVHVLHDHDLALVMTAFTGMVLGLIGGTMSRILWMERR